MKQVNVHEAKSTLSELIARVEAGEEVVIARAGKPVVRLLPVQASEGPILRRAGALKGAIVYSADFEQADAEIAELLGGS